MKVVVTSLSLLIPLVVVQQQHVKVISGFSTHHYFLPLRSFGLSHELKSSTSLTLSSAGVPDTEKTSIPLDVENKHVTTMTFYKVDNKEQQEEYIKNLQSNMIPLAQAHAGFISANLHASLDGVKVANYAQWTTMEDFEDFCDCVSKQAKNNNDGTILPIIESQYVYKIVDWDSKIENIKKEPPAIGFPYIVHFAEFTMLDAKHQPKMVELAKENLKIAMPTPGLLTATFHQSIDNSMSVINYGQWENEQAIEELKKTPGFGTGVPYWDGLANNEHHLYKLVASYSK